MRHNMCGSEIVCSGLGGIPEKAVFMGQDHKGTLEARKGTLTVPCGHRKTYLRLMALYENEHFVEEA